MQETHADALAKTWSGTGVFTRRPGDGHDPIGRVMGYALAVVRIDRAEWATATKVGVSRAHRVAR